MVLRKWINLICLLFGLILLPACGPGLLTAENPLVKAEREIPPTILPTETKSDTEDQGQSSAEKEDMITITLVYDNYPFRAGLETAWGFSALITYQGQNLLFDTGGDGAMLLRNMAALEIDPALIQNVFLSHEHSDHTGGMQALLRAGADPTTYIPPSFSSQFKDNYSRQVEVIEVTPGLPVMESTFSLGEMAGPPPEQALVIDSAQGLVVITGCAHPGIADIVLKANEEFEKDIYLVLGGFHLGSASTAEVNEIINEFKRVGVHYVAPCHCTGDQVINTFKDAYEEGFLQVGVGKVIVIEN